MPEFIHEIALGLRAMKGGQRDPENDVFWCRACGTFPLFKLIDAIKHAVANQFEVR